QYAPRDAYALVDARALQPDVPDLLSGSGHYLCRAAGDASGLRSQPRPDGARAGGLHVGIRHRPDSRRLARRPLRSQARAHRTDRVDVDLRLPDRRGRWPPFTVRGAIAPRYW